MVEFKTTKAESRLVSKIVKRIRLTHGSLDPLSMMMDIEAVHSNGCPLDLQGLLDADDFNFDHDIFGIINHIDRSTGKLDGHFVPRYSRQFDDPYRERDDEIAEIKEVETPAVQS